MTEKSNQNRLRDMAIEDLDQKHKSAKSSDKYKECHLDRIQFQKILDDLATKSPQTLADLVKRQGIRVRYSDDGQIIGYRSPAPPYFFQSDPNLTGLIGRISESREAQCKR